MDVFEIRDSGSTPVGGFDLDWLPPWAYDYVTPRMSRDGRRLELEAGPFVGTIPLAGERVLYVVPRAGHRSFSRMLLITESLDQALQDELDELAALGAEAGEASWVKLLSRSFIGRLREIEKESLAPGRIERRERLSHVRGRVEVVPTLRAIANRETLPVVCRYRAKTYQTPENRVLATAADQLLRIGEIGPEQRPVAVRWAKRLDGRKLRPSELRRVIVGLGTRRYTGFRPYYVPALLMARLILSQGGMSFTRENMIETETLLTNMPILFERYVRRIMANELSPRGYIVEKVEGGAKARHLFLDGTCEMLPDVLVSDAGGVQLVADAKYKPESSISPSDYYQMAAYLDTYGCDKGMLVQAVEGEVGCTTEPTRRRMRNGKQVFELQIPLNNPQEAEASLAEATETVLRATA